MTFRKTCLSLSLLIGGIALSGCASVFDQFDTVFSPAATPQKAALAAPEPAPVKKRVVTQKRVAEVKRPTPVVAAKPAPAAAPKKIEIRGYDDEFGGAGGEGGGDAGGGGGWSG